MRWRHQDSLLAILWPHYWTNASTRTHSCATKSLSSDDVHICLVPRGAAEQIVIGNIASFTRHKTLLNISGDKPKPLLCASHPGLALKGDLSGLSLVEGAEEYFMLEDNNKYVFVSEATLKGNSHDEALRNLTHVTVLIDGTMTTNISAGVLGVRFCPSFRVRGHPGHEPLKFKMPGEPCNYTPMTITNVPGLAITSEHQVRRDDHYHYHDSEGSHDSWGDMHDVISMKLSLGPEGNAVGFCIKNCKCHRDYKRAFELEHRPPEPALDHVDEFGNKVFKTQMPISPAKFWNHVDMGSNDGRQLGYTLHMGPIDWRGTPNGWGVGNIIGLPEHAEWSKKRMLRFDPETCEFECDDKVMGVLDISRLLSEKYLRRMQSEGMTVVSSLERGRLHR